MANKLDFDEIKKWAEKKLSDMRAQNDNQMEASDTDHLRGKIEFAKELLALEKEDKNLQVGNTGYLED